MDIRRADLAHGDELDGVVVVVDVLRAFTTAAYAFAAGARAMVAVRSPGEIAHLKARHAPAITVGAQPGGRPVPGLDYGNSPSGIAALDLSGVTLIEYSAGGVRGLVDCARASDVLAGSLVCARATAGYIRRLAPSAVTFLITGLWTDRDGDEDHACADLVEAHLLGHSPNLSHFEERVRRSDFGRRFGHPDFPQLPAMDIELAARADRFGFAMPMRRDGDRLVVEPTRIGAT